MRRALVTALLLLALLAPAAANAAIQSRDAAIDAFRQVTADEKVDPGWTGSVDNCTVGTESQASLDATLDTVNILRSFAGLQPVAFDPQYNHYALAAALMMAAAHDLSHTPGPTWPCYSDDGALGAGTSNLFLGRSGASAMVGYVEDGGVASLGHRRWVIDPGTAVMGSGSTGPTNALKVFGDAPGPTVAAGSQVSWPPAGYVPWDWVFGTWSLALGGTSDASQFNFDGAQVQVAIDGQQLQVKNVQTLEDGYGTGHTLSWEVAVPPSATEGDHELKVTIDGITKGNAAFPVAYTVKAVHIPDEAKCNAAKDKLAKAKDKLKKLRQNHASKKKIKRAKQKVQRAKDAVVAAC
jgi:uncharacterized protein YkwD